MDTTTPEQRAAEKIGRAIDGQLFRLKEEKLTLLAAAARILEIDAEMAVLESEKAKIDPRRPPAPSVITPTVDPPVVLPNQPVKIAK
jgi:hypothetical protein